MKYVFLKQKQKKIFCIKYNHFSFLIFFKKLNLFGNNYKKKIWRNKLLV